jgi:hypothetical protein
VIKWLHVEKARTVLKKGRIKNLGAKVDIAQVESGLKREFTNECVFVGSMCGK